MKKLYFVFYFIILFFIFIFIFSSNSFAAYPKLVTTFSTAFETIESWILKISTPAAAVAVRNWCFHEKIQFW